MAANEILDYKEMRCADSSLTQELGFEDFGAWKLFGEEGEDTKVETRQVTGCNMQGHNIIWKKIEDDIKSLDSKNVHDNRKTFLMGSRQEIQRLMRWQIYLKE
jgi:hypothetical protein